MIAARMVRRTGHGAMPFVDEIDRSIAQLESKYSSNTAKVS